jgi:branched-chain amino acid transport system substrate-binding protein
MTKRKWVAVATATLALASLAATAGFVDAGQARPGAPTSTAASTVKVGVITDVTGLNADFGAEYLQGLRAGLRYATKGTNTVNGHKIQLTVKDEGGVPATGVTQAKDLIGQGYKILVGPATSGVSLAIGPIAAQNKILFISGPAAFDGITGLNRYTFRSGRQTYQDVLAIQGILGKKAVGRKIVVFAQDTAFGNGNVAAVTAVLGGKGHTISKILVPQSATDFTPFARQAKQAKPNLLFVAWAGDTAPAMWRAMQQQGVLKGTKVATGLANQGTWKFYVPGINFLSHYVYNAPRSPVNKWLRAHIKGHKPDLFVPDGFVTAQMIVRAVQKTGGTDVEKMIRALEGWRFTGPKGAQQIRKADHAMLQPMFQVRLKFKGSKITPLPQKIFLPKTVAPPVRPFS